MPCPLPLGEGLGEGCSATSKLGFEDTAARWSEDRTRPYRTLTFVISFPSGSIACTAQAIQGSKEWIVRSTSSGLSAWATGLPTSDASYGPITPLSSRGEAFQVDGTTAW